MLVLPQEVYDRRPAPTQALSGVPPIKPGAATSSSGDMTRPDGVPDGHIPVWLHPSLANDVMNFFEPGSNAAIPHVVDSKGTTQIVKAGSLEPPYTLGPAGRRDPEGPVADADWMASHGTRFRGGIVNEPVQPLGDLDIPPIGSSEIPPVQPSPPDDVNLFDDPENAAAATPTPTAPPTRIVAGPGRIGGRGPIVDLGRSDPRVRMPLFNISALPVSRLAPGVQGGDVTYGGTTTHTPGNPPTLIDDPNNDWTGRDTNAADRNFRDAEQRGAEETARLKASGELNPDGTRGPAGSTSTGTTGTGGGGSTATRLASILNSYPTLNNPAAIRAINGGANPRDLIGHAQFDSHAAGLMEMAFQSYGGAPNFVANDRETNPIFYPNAGTSMGRADEESGTVLHTDQKLSSGSRNADPRWVFPSQSVSAKGGFSFVQNTDKYNQWLKDNNQWYYGPGGVLEQQKQAAANKGG